MLYLCASKAMPRTILQLLNLGLLPGAFGINRDHAAGLAIAVQKWFWRLLFPILLGNFSLFVEGMIAHFTEEIYMLEKAEHEWKVTCH
jgi:hypothetical protein